MSLWSLYPVSIPSLCSMLFMVMFLSVLNSPHRMSLLTPRVHANYTSGPGGRTLQEVFGLKGIPTCSVAFTLWDYLHQE